MEFMHVKPGKGAAFVRTKLKNVITGATIERTFSPTDKMPEAHIERKDMQYCTMTGTCIIHGYGNIRAGPLGTDTVGDSLKFIKENMNVKILSYKGNVFGIEPPTFVELEVIETEPGFRGDTATNVTKPATVETGAVVKVPLFIDKGDMIRIDTRTGEYLERA